MNYRWKFPGKSNFKVIHKEMEAVVTKTVPYNYDEYKSSMYINN